MTPSYQNFRQPRIYRNLTVLVCHSLAAPNTETLVSRTNDLDAQVRRAQAGDPDAFSAVVRTYAGPIRAWAVARCPPGVDADDIAQDTFIEAFKRLSDYTPGTDFRAWLFAIARYQLMTACTRARRVADYHSRYAPMALADELERRAAEAVCDPDPASRLGHLRACLGRLDGPARDALRCRYEFGLGIGEIATRIGRTVGATKKHLYDIRQKLHDCIRSRMSESEPV